VKTAVATTATATTATSTAAMLAKGAMKAMYLAKVKLVAAIAAAVIMTGTAVPIGIAVAQAVGKEDTASKVQLAIEDGQVGNYRLDIGVGPNGKTASLAEMTFSLKDLANGQVCNKAPGINGVLETISALTTNGHRISVTISFDDRLSLRLVRDVCREVSGVETEKGMHVELPPVGQLYYRAFLPDESTRVRENRPTQPWELKLTKTGTTVSGTITRIEEVWRDDSLKPNLVPTDFAVATPDAMLQVLREKGPGMPVILVFAPPELTYGELMRFVGPCVKTHGTIHVYLADLS
jgi:hypothetical protein